MASGEVEDGLPVVVGSVGVFAEEVSGVGEGDEAVFDVMLLQGALEAFGVEGRDEFVAVAVGHEGGDGGVADEPGGREVADGWGDVAGEEVVAGDVLSGAGAGEFPGEIGIEVGPGVGGEVGWAGLLADERDGEWGDVGAGVGVEHGEVRAGGVAGEGDGGEGASVAVGELAELAEAGLDVVEHVVEGGGGVGAVEGVGEGGGDVAGLGEALAGVGDVLSPSAVPAAAMDEEEGCGGSLAEREIDVAGESSCLVIDDVGEGVAVGCFVPVLDEVGAAQFLVQEEGGGGAAGEGGQEESDDEEAEVASDSGECGVGAGGWGIHRRLVSRESAAHGGG